MRRNLQLLLWNSPLLSKVKTLEFDASLCAQKVSCIAEAAVLQLNNQLLRFIFTSFPHVLKDCTNFMLHNLLQCFGIEIVVTHVHNKLEGISLLRTEVTVQAIQTQANLDQIQLHEDFLVYLMSICILFSDPYSVLLICRTGKKPELKLENRFPELTQL